MPNHRVSYIFTLKLTRIYTYEYVLEIGTTIVKKQQRNQHASPGGNASTAEAAPGRFGRGEQGEARRANTTPNGGPPLELRRAFTAHNLV